MLSFSISIRKVVIVLVLIAFWLAVLSITGKHIEAYAGTERPHILSEVVRLFNINRESSIPTWYASSLLLACAGLLAVIAHSKGYETGQRRYWLGLALVFLYLSIDEASEIHERLTEPLQAMFNTSGPLYFAWMVAFIPLLVVFGVVYFRFWWKLPPRYRQLFLLSACFYIGGAVGIEMVGSNMWYQDGGSSLLYSTIGTIEEFFEMLGAATLIYTLLTYIAEPASVIHVELRAAAQTVPQPAEARPLLRQEWEVMRAVESARSKAETARP